MIIYELGAICHEWVQDNPLSGNPNIDRKIVTVIMSLVTLYYLSVYEKVTAYVKQKFGKDVTEPPYFYHSVVVCDKKINKALSDHLLLHVYENKDMSRKKRMYYMIMDKYTGERSVERFNGGTFTPASITICTFNDIEVISYIGGGDSGYLFFRSCDVSEENLQSTVFDFIDSFYTHTVISKVIEERDPIVVYHLENIQGSVKWVLHSTVKNKNVNSITSTSGKQLLNGIKTFIDNKQLYTALGIPTKRTYLLYGVPGTGKSSCIPIISRIYGLNIYRITFKEPRVTETDYIKAFNKIPKDSLVLMDDVESSIFSEGNITYMKKPAEYYNGSDSDSDTDTEKPKKKKKTKKYKIPNDSDEMVIKISYNTLLVMTDGIDTPDGTRVVIITTNHPEQIGKAMIRPGRIDKLLHFDYMTPEEIETFIVYFISIIDCEITDRNIQEFIKKLEYDSIKIVLAEIYNYFTIHAIKNLDSCVEGSNILDHIYNEIVTYNNQRKQISES
jgi:hypothetical protein